MRQTFSSTSHEFTSEGRSSLLIIAAFAFLSHFIGPTSVGPFLESTQLFHHFMFAEVIGSDHLPTLVENIADVDVFFFESVLCGLLRFHESNPSRLVGKAIGSIIKRDPDGLLSCVMNHSPSLSLLSYLFQTIKFDFTRVDLLPMARTAFDILSSDGEKTNVSEVDDDDTTFRISLKSYKKMTFAAADALGRPAIHSLPLPKVQCFRTRTIRAQPRAGNHGRERRPRRRARDLRFRQLATSEFSERTSGVLQTSSCA
jgi:hypothetical protein